MRHFPLPPIFLCFALLLMGCQEKRKNDATPSQFEEKVFIAEESESEISSPSRNEHLKDLEWLVGEWIDDEENPEVSTGWRYDKFKNFLFQEFTINKNGKLVMEGKQLVAWDPLQEEIRSWVFDSDGGFGEGKWKKKEESWTVESAHTLPDGRRASSINIYTPIDQDSFTWESVGREVDGEILPDIDPVTFVRRKK